MAPESTQIGVPLARNAIQASVSAGAVGRGMRIATPTVLRVCVSKNK